MKPIPPAREALEETDDVRYMEPNRDRVVGSDDRTGRHFDEELEELLPEDPPKDPAGARDEGLGD